MKLVKHICYDEKFSPKEAAIAPLCHLVLESKTEVMEILNGLCPKWAWIEKVEFKHGCHLAGRCDRTKVECIEMNGFIVTFYGEVFLTTVLHELAHIADNLRHGHDEEFMAHNRALIKMARRMFKLDDARVPLVRRESKVHRSMYHPKPRRRALRCGIVSASAVSLKQKNGNSRVIRLRNRP